VYHSTQAIFKGRNNNRRPVGILAFRAASEIFYSIKALSLMTGVCEFMARRHTFP